VTLDANHSLAGETITLTVQLVEVMWEVGWKFKSLFRCLSVFE
jgi:FKBP-type peptidyl-prolyl cis-trans isomerase 2